MFGKDMEIYCFISFLYTYMHNAYIYTCIHTNLTGLPFGRDSTFPRSHRSNRLTNKDLNVEYGVLPIAF